MIPPYRGKPLQFDDYNFHLAMLRYIFVFKFPLHGVQPINEFIWMRSPFKLQNVNIYVEISLEFMII
jgi:hypothetical protein